MAIAEIALILGSCLLCTSGWAPPKFPTWPLSHVGSKLGITTTQKKKRWNDGLQIVLGQMGGRKFQNWNAYSL